MIENFVVSLEKIKVNDNIKPNILEGYKKEAIPLNYEPLYEGDKVSKENEEFKGIPKEGGSWEGERGNSDWYPDREEIPKKQAGLNPDNMTWGEILDKYGIEKIPFKDGEPDFSEISKESVEINEFTDNRRINFTQADEKAAEIRGCSPQEVKKWREENNYTWHERSDCKTMDKVPSQIHNCIPHSGGISKINQT